MLKPIGMQLGKTEQLLLFSLFVLSWDFQPLLPEGSVDNLSENGEKYKSEKEVSHNYE